MTPYCIDDAAQPTEENLFPVLKAALNDLKLLLYAHKTECMMLSKNNKNFQNSTVQGSNIEIPW